ncbi:Adhesion G protein-coupled receptor A2, partial [Bulinus truncatus]
MDSFDVFYLAKIMTNLLPQAALDALVSSLFVNVISNVSNLPPEALDMAQFESRAPTSNLSSNLITYIEPGAFDGLQSLKKLDLSNNAIGAISSNMFTGLPKLEKLFLSSNRISVIPDGTFNDLRSMKRIEFSSQYLRCDCHLKWILKWAKQQHVRIPGSTVCGVPLEMKGRPLSKLKRGDLHCDHNFQLHIFEIRPSQSQLVFIGDKLPLECHVSVNLQDKINISWYRGGQIVTTNKSLGIYVHTSHSHDQTITNHSLIVDSLDPSHAGDWSCIVSSDKGNLTKMADIVAGDFTSVANGINKALAMIGDSKEVMDSFDGFYWTQTHDKFTSSSKAARCIGDNVSNLPPEVLDMAQFESRAPTRMVKMLEQMTDQVKAQHLVSDWTRYSENVIVVVFNKKQILQNGISCVLKEGSVRHGFSSSSFYCGNISFP